MTKKIKSMKSRMKVEVKEAKTVIGIYIDFK